MSSFCLNCNSELISKFCHTCGQKASVHRYDLKHFVVHDMVHGVLHVDNSLPKTIIQIFTTPGHSIRKYLNGKRGKLFNFITLIILLLAIYTLLMPYVTVKMADLVDSGTTKKTMKVLEEFTKKYPKSYMIFSIPIYSIFSFLWFRKAKLNFFEHLVLNSYRACGEYIIALCFTIFTIFYTELEGVKKVNLYIISPMIFAYPVFMYYQLFGAYGYSKKSLLFRILMSYISFYILITILGVIVALIYRYVNNIH